VVGLHILLICMGIAVSIQKKKKKASINHWVNYPVDIAECQNKNQGRLTKK